MLYNAPPFCNGFSREQLRFCGGGNIDNRYLKMKLIIIVNSVFGDIKKLIQDGDRRIGVHPRKEVVEDSKRIIMVINKCMNITSGQIDNLLVNKALQSFSK